MESLLLGLLSYLLNGIGFLPLGFLCPVTLDDLHVVWGVGLGDFYHVVCGVHRRLSVSFMR